MGDTELSNSVGFYRLRQEYESRPNLSVVRARFEVRRMYGVTDVSPVDYDDRQGAGPTSNLRSFGKLVAPFFNGL